MTSQRPNNSNGNNNGQQSSCRNGSQGHGRGNGGGRGHGNGGHGSRGWGNNQECGWSSNCIEPKHWNGMSWEECQANPEAHNHAESANNASVNGTQDNKSTIAVPPTTVNVSDRVDGNHNNCQANTANQTIQGSINPGAMIQTMMSSACACGTDVSSGARQDRLW